MEDQKVENQKVEPAEEIENLSEDEAVDALTAYFRRTSRGRIVDLPRWAQ